jgi:hypothetical protein
MDSDRLANQNRWQTYNNHPTVGRHISEASGGLASDQNRETAQHYNIGRAHTRCHVTDAGLRKIPG